jgi:diketogulonate reductase-like aldo/keto reductase
MRYRTLPNTDLSVSTVGFGLWTVAMPWWGIDDDAVGIRLMQRAFDLGITFFDTADTYGEGSRERERPDSPKGVRAGCTGAFQTRPWRGCRPPSAR